MPVLVALLFFVSGVTALVGEVVWMRMLGLVLGNTVWAASAVVAVWMGGMAGGAWLGGKLASRTSRHLRWYGLAEAAIGGFFGLSPVILGLLLAAGTRLGPDLGQHLAAGIAARLGLAVLVLAVPTVLMGLTLPLLVERLRGSRLAGKVGVLYGINTLGAFAGVMTAAYVLLPRLGEGGSLSVAALACALVAVCAVGLEGHVPPPSPAGEVVLQGGDQNAVPRRYLALVGAMGFVALAAELVWVRILVLHLGSRVYAFAVLLAVYLLGIALGSLVVRGLSGRISRPARALASLQLGLGLVLVLQLVGLGFADRVLSAVPGLLRVPLTFTGLQAVVFTGVLVLFVPVTLLFGASFPLAVDADPGRRPDGEHVARVAAANTVGGILGALAAPFLLVPLLGSQWTQLLLAAISLGIAGLLWPRLRRHVLLWATLAVIVAVGVALPRDWVLRRAAMGQGVELLEVDESVTATVLVKRYEDARGSWLSLELNGVNVAGDSPELLVVQQMQGQIPLLQVVAPRTVLHVGFGSGGTCWAVARHPVERIDVVEISPEVLRASDRLFAHINHHVLADPRVRTIINDGRNYLLATDATYDVILSDSIHPVYAGNSTLYTLEYFRLCREHLNPGGIVSMWLPLYSLDQDSFLRILRAFVEVFPRTVVWHDTGTVNEFTVVTGQVEPGPVRIRWNLLEDPRLAESLRIAGLDSPLALGADLLQGPREVAFLTRNVPPHVDDLPVVEYLSGRVLDRDRTWYDNLALLAAFRARSNPFAGLPVPWRDVLARRDPAILAQERALRDRLTASR